MTDTERSHDEGDDRLAEPEPGFPTVSFEAARAELERIVGELESGQADLERAVELWERGEELHRFCVERLEAAEGRIEELARRTARRGAGTADAESGGSEDAGTVAP